jgi:hypothetical protein
MTTYNPFDGFTVADIIDDRPEAGATTVLHHKAGCDIEKRWPGRHAETATPEQRAAATEHCGHCLEALGLPRSSRPPRPDPTRDAGRQSDAERIARIYRRR